MTFYWIELLSKPLGAQSVRNKVLGRGRGGIQRQSYANVTRIWHQSHSHDLKKYSNLKRKLTMLLLYIQTWMSFMFLDKLTDYALSGMGKIWRWIGS